MKLHNIAINNLRRRKAKVCFLVMGLLVGVASVVALLSITRSLAEDMVHKMDEFGANILIIPKSEGLSLNYGGIDLGGLSFDQKEISQDDLAKIKTIDNAANIRLVSPKVLDVFEMNGQKALAVGVDFPSELALKKWWVINGTTPKSDSEVILGREAAVKLAVNVGSRLDIKGSELWVSGVLDTTGSQDDSLVFMPLPVSQKIFGKEGKISMVEIAALCKNCPISDIVNQISAIIPTGKVTAVQQVVAGRMDTLNHFQRFSLGISGLVLLVGAMVVFVTMMGSVNERTREIGIFSAIGFRSSHIMKIILLEAFLVSFSAGLLGYLVGVGVTYGTLRALSDHAPNLTIDYTMAVGSVFLAVLVGLLASFYPARSAAAMDPSEALRTL